MIKNFIFYAILYTVPSVFKKLFYRRINKITWENMQNEESDLLLMDHFLTKNSIYFDVGANNGMFTYKTSKIIKEPNIYAFEPVPKLYVIVNTLFKKANIYNLAFSNQIKSGVNFKIPVIGNRKNYFRGTLNTSYKEEGESNSESIKVDVTTIDNFIESKNLNKVDMIKIDVEGHELDVIKGATNCLTTLQPILQIEIEQRHHTKPISEIIEYVKGFDYDCYYFNPETFKLTLLNVDPSTLQKKEDFMHINYINNFYFAQNGQFGLKYYTEINQEIEKLLN